ncbi:hypothetical protein F5B18DRAFT_657369 [Nemania serpens]|nr:hypothetical protein F5B18DRAFT_657369 [Nemania serpens]
MATRKNLVIAAIFFIVAQSFMHVVAAAPAHSPDADHSYVVERDHHRIYNGTLSCNGTFSGNGTSSNNGTASSGRHSPYCQVHKILLYIHAHQVDFRTM